MMPQTNKLTKLPKVITPHIIGVLFHWYWYFLTSAHEPFLDMVKLIGHILFVVHTRASNHPPSWRYLQILQNPSSLFHSKTLIYRIPFSFQYIFKSIVQISLVLWVVFHWLYHKYHIDYTQRKLYEYKGFLHTKEHMSELKNIRDVSMEQTIFGKIFNYGNIVLTISASGGYAEKVIMKKIQEPELYVDFLETCGL